VRKLTSRFQRWLVHRAINQRKRKLRRVARLRGSKTRIAVFSNELGTRLIRIAGEGQGTPTTLCLDQNYDETIAFFHDLRQRTRLPTKGALVAPRGRRPARIGWVRNYRDFTKLKHISVGAALILASEYDRIARLTGFRPAAVDVHLWDPYVATTLSRLGFFDLLRLGRYEHEPVDALIVKKMVSDSVVRGEAVEQIKSLFGQIKGQRKIQIDMSSATMDALENVVGHANRTGPNERGDHRAGGSSELPTSRRAASSWASTITASPFRFLYQEGGVWLT
jgi:hypothetical protein